MKAAAGLACGPICVLLLEHFTLGRIAGRREGPGAWLCAWLGASSGGRLAARLIEAGRAESRPIEDRGRVAQRLANIPLRVVPIWRSEKSRPKVWKGSPGHR
jgi:hypothetical protein